MNSIELHIFTNTTINAPSTTMIESTYKSFCKVFGDSLKPKIWCDVNPYTEKARAYMRNLNNVFGNFVPTKSLSDGYIKAVQGSDAEFMFMLEHDWLFNNNITHSLKEIISVMKHEDILHLRFNKRCTQPIHSDEWLKEKSFNNFYYCETPSISNNPHIINRNKYVEDALPLIELRKGSLGIEHKLNKSNLNGTIYGPLDFHPTIAHLDGRIKK